jgi:hypothetical protein
MREQRPLPGHRTRSIQNDRTVGTLRLHGFASRSPTEAAVAGYARS